jgi:hypothetical protein
MALIGLGAFYYYLSLPRWAISYDAVIRSHLRNASVAQASYFLYNNRYSESLDKLYEPGEGVTIRVVYADDKHFRIEGSHKKGTHIFHMTEQSTVVYDEKGRAYDSG